MAEYKSYTQLTIRGPNFCKQEKARSCKAVYIHAYLYTFSNRWQPEDAGNGILLFV